MTTPPNKRGGLRSPAGGRPRLPEGERRVKINISLAPATVEKLKEQRERPNEPISRVVERLIEKGLL